MGGAGAGGADSKWKQQDRDHPGGAADQRVQEHPEDLLIVAVFCQNDGFADEAARQEKELRHGLLPALDWARRKSSDEAWPSDNGDLRAAARTTLKTGNARVVPRRLRRDF